MSMEPLVPIEDVAKHFRVSLSTARKWVKDGIIPENMYVKIGKTHRFALSEVSRALMQRVSDDVGDNIASFDDDL
tara:strand:+ start:560 stop:784 length:225 start_codon:yes stop_codon:yes gene_type:complete